MDEISTLRFIAANPRCSAPPDACRSITRLLRFQLIKHASPGYRLRSGGVETLVRDGRTPQWVRDMIKHAASSKE
jgi:hypothetical protein